MSLEHISGSLLAAERDGNAQGGSSTSSRCGSTQQGWAVCIASVHPWLTASGTVIYQFAALTSVGRPWQSHTPAARA
jgi:hypothetical protein